MKCPACSHELTELMAGAVTVDVCKGGCGGIWFDHKELKNVDEQHEDAGDLLMGIERASTEQALSRRWTAKRAATARAATMP